MNNIEYPVKIKDISKFETQNPAISVNVFALEKSDDIKTLYPLYTSNHKDREHEVDLLYLEKNCNTHYCLIKNLESLFSNNGNKVHICRNCMTCFTTSEAFKKHQEICLQHEYCKVKVPTEKTLKFNKAHFKSRLPVVIYADFESMNLKLHTVKSSDDKPYNIPVFKQEVISFGLYVKSDYNNLFTSQYHTYTGYDAKEEFIKEIIRIYNDVSRKLYNCSQAHKTVKLTLTQQKDFNQATHCYICNREFPKDVSEKLTEGSEDITEALSAEGITSSVLKKRNKKLNKGSCQAATEGAPKVGEAELSSDKASKIREHNHFNGKYRGAACQSCNTNEGKASKIIPVFFHNGSGYDFHFIITELMKYENQYDKVDVLAKNSEEYISITYGNIYRKLVFLDSYRFLQKGLSDVAKSLDLKDLNITKKYFNNHELIRQKGVYPYDYITSLKILNEIQLPPIEAFYSVLKGESINEEEYKTCSKCMECF